MVVGSKIKSVVVLAGGVGAARFLRGLAIVHDQQATTALVNTGDDTILHGLNISPDIDTVIYTLSESIDSKRGWGLANETWRAMESLKRYVDVRPPGSIAAPEWFNLGDQDLATHFYRTARRSEGADASQITSEIARAWKVAQRIVPMTNSDVSTLVELAQDWQEKPFFCIHGFQEKCKHFLRQGVIKGFWLIVDPTERIMDQKHDHFFLVICRWFPGKTKDKSRE